MKPARQTPALRVRTLLLRPARTTAFLCLASVGLTVGGATGLQLSALPVVPVHAAQSGTTTRDRHSATTSTSPTINWEQHDTAVYVVSTVNLLRTRNGHPLLPILRRRLGVVRLDVLADRTQDGLYFIQLRRADGTGPGALAYQMGWAKPESVTASCKHFGIAQAPANVIEAYQNDPAQLIGSFTSTFPS